MLRYNADLRSLTFIFITIGLLFYLWNFGSEMSTLNWVFFYSWQLLMAVIISVITHNHQHLSIWTAKPLNVLTDNILTLFYGFPVFVWIPTHNSNHHVHINKEPDYTKTYMASEKNNIITLLSYPALCAAEQLKAIVRYLGQVFTKHRSKFYLHILQIVILVSWILAAFVLDWQKALLYVIIPQQVSLFTVLVFNYLQHIHADEESEFNHSRNMTGSVMNFILLNNGLHTVHHNSPGTHWSKLREKHEKIVHKIDPRLNEENILLYLFRTYILGIFSSSYRTDNMRMERIQKGN